MNSDCQALVPVNPGAVEVLDAPVRKRGRPRKVVATVDIVDVVENAARNKPQVEDEAQRFAFDYFYRLGNARTLVAVAEKTQVKIRRITEWSRQFRWDERIKELGKSDRIKRIQDLRSRALELKWGTVFMVEPLEQKTMVLDPSNSSVGLLKDLGSETSKYIHDHLDINESKKDDNEKPGGKRGGVMVNVIIKK